MLWVGGGRDAALPRRARPNTHPDRLMRTLTALALAALLLQAAPLSAQASPASASHRAAAVRLLEVTRARAALEGIPDASVPAPLQGMADMQALQPMMRELFREQLSWSSLEPEYVRVYTEVFTERELRELIAFYETPLGQKMLDKMPVAAARTQAIMMERLQRAMPQLMERMQRDMLSREGPPAPRKP
jgi:uncharacterized protein